MKKHWRALALSVAILGLVAYLRDPPWLIKVESGFYGWELNRARQPFRWMGHHASFFVPSDAASVAIPLHALFITDDRSPFVIRVFVNDRPATMVTLADEEWQTVNLRLVPPTGTRRVARIDLRANRTWSDRAISVQVGEVKVER